MEIMPFNFKATQNWNQKTASEFNVILFDRNFSIEEMAGVKCGGLNFHAKFKLRVPKKTGWWGSFGQLEIQAIAGMETKVV